MNGWMVIAVMGVVGAAGTQQQTSNEQLSAQVTKHVAIIDTGLSQADESAEMLGKLASHANAYDKPHGEVFLNYIQTGIADARAHLLHLDLLAQSDAEKRETQQLQSDLRRLQQTARTLEANLSDPDAVKASASRLRSQIDAAEEPLERIAKTMNSMIDVG